MQELDIHGQPIQQTDPHVGRPPGLRGGWEGGDAAGGGGGGEGAAGGGDGGAGAATAGGGKVTVDEAVDKLDSMMELVLEHIGRRCEAGARAGARAGVGGARVRAVRAVSEP
jgi:hypothetical protein